MAGNGTGVVSLSDVKHGQEADCFAVLVKNEKLLTKGGNPYFRCSFRAKHETRAAMIWSDHPMHPEAEAWKLGVAYRLTVVGEDSSYGPQIKIKRIRPVAARDAADGYNYNDLLECSKFPPEVQFSELVALVDAEISDRFLQELVRQLLIENKDEFQKMPAAQKIHHTYSGGLLEHVRSLALVCKFLADHYSTYYSDLKPPLNKSVLLAAAILHDIGKLRELRYHPIESEYTKEGNLIGHIVLGRDMVREAARKITGFPDETLLLLEHAILAHHGKLEFGSPKQPATIEALIVHYADEIDSKVNSIVQEWTRGSSDEQYSSKVFALDNRRFYKSTPARGEP